MVGIHFFDIFHTLVIKLGLLFPIVILPILGSHLSNLQLDFERVERFNNRLVSVVPVVSNAIKLRLLPLYDFFSCVLGLYDLISQCLHSTLVNLHLVLFENFE